jgi:integrase
VQALYAAALATGLAPRTVRHVHTVLHSALEQAVRWGHVARNVCDVVEPPSVPAQELHPPTGEHVAALLDAAEASEDRLRALWALAVYTGMRLGELTGLAWADVALERGLLRVRRILVSVRDRTPAYGEPKTARSRRTVPLNEEAIAQLRAHRDRQQFERRAYGEGYGMGRPLDLVFSTHLGTPLDARVVHAHFKRALGRAGLPHTIRFHDLRHAAATLMPANGVDIPTVAAVLGHSKNSTTLDVNAHAVPSKVLTATGAIQLAVRAGRGRV